MPYEDIFKLLKSTGIPVTYNAWKTKKKLPYICYLNAYSNNFAADGNVYYLINHLQIELYTEEKDTEAEEKVEQALSSFFWEKTEEYIDTERCYQIIYEIEV